MIYEKDRQVTIDQIRNGQAAMIAKRLGIDLKPVNGLTCTCGHAQCDCTCKLVPTRDAKPQYAFGNHHLIAGVLAMRNLSDRMDKVESTHATRQQSMAQGTQAPQDIINAASQKAQAHLAETYARKVDEGILESHQKRAAEAYRMANGDPREPDYDEPQGDVDTESHKHGAPLDESCGGNRQATTQFPLGKSRMTGDAGFVTAEEAKRLFSERDSPAKSRTARLSA